MLPHALDASRPGGMIACYSPSIIQVQRTVEALEVTRGFTQIESLEVLYRPWQIKGQAVRPVQQMVSHTAFLTFARRLAAYGRRPWDESPATDPADEDDAGEDAVLDSPNASSRWRVRAAGSCSVFEWVRGLESTSIFGRRCATIELMPVGVMRASRSDCRRVDAGFNPRHRPDAHA